LPDLDGTHIEYSYKQTNLITVLVEGPNGQNKTLADNQEWHLPTFDPRNENKYMYKLHAVDIYFWTKEDALQFLNGIRRVVPEQQISIHGEPLPPPPHLEEMSPIVQKLENIAIADPGYQGDMTRNARTSSFPGPKSRGIKFRANGLQPSCTSCTRSNTAQRKNPSTRGWGNKSTSRGR